MELVEIKNCTQHAVLSGCSCPQDSFVMVLAPGYAHLSAIMILHLDSFLASRYLVPHVAPPVGQGQRREIFLAKVPVPHMRNARCLRRVTQPHFIAGPL